MQGPLVVLLTTLLAVSVSAVPMNSYTPSSDGHLHIIHVTDNSLEAIFYNADAGIRIRANSLSLSLYSMDGEELLLSGDKPHGSSLFATIMGHSFLGYNTTLEDGTQKIVDYVVPESLAEQAKQAVESAKVERMLSQLSDSDAEEATDSAFQELFQRAEITLIESAAVALGRAGVMGYENQGALNFYMVARALIKARGREAEGESGDESIDEERYEDMYQDEAMGQRKKRFLSRVISTAVSTAVWLASRPISEVVSRLPFPRYCPNNGRICGRCPRGSNCLGMCGPDCTCWSWACGNCCYHGGCYDHDRCCERGNRSRCQIPIGFNCFSFSC